MADGRAELSPELLTQLDRYTQKHPGRRELIERLVKKRAEAESQSERDTIEKMLVAVVNPSRLWLYLALGIPLALGALFFAFDRADRNHAAAVAAGRPGTAYIERMDDGDCWFGTKTSTCIHVVLRVHVEGQPSYRAELTESVPNRYLPRVQPGSWITVSVDEKDPSLVLLDEDALAVPPPAPIVSP